MWRQGTFYLWHRVRSADGQRGTEVDALSGGALSLVTKGAGSQGVQNGSISCIALPESLPGGVRVRIGRESTRFNVGAGMCLWQRCAGVAFARSANGQVDAPVYPLAPILSIPATAPCPNATIFLAAAITMPRISTTTTCYSVICQYRCRPTPDHRARGADDSPRRRPGDPGDLRRVGLSADYGCRSRSRHDWPQQR